MTMINKQDIVHLVRKKTTSLSCPHIMVIFLWFSMWHANNNHVLLSPFSCTNFLKMMKTTRMRQAVCVIYSILTCYYITKIQSYNALLLILCMNYKAFKFECMLESTAIADSWPPVSWDGKMDPEQLPSQKSTQKHQQKRVFIPISDQFVMRLG